MTDNFKDHPPTIGELRSDRTDDGRDWSPRDLLITLLREIDNGLNIDALSVSYRFYEGEKPRYRYKQASPDLMIAVGLFAAGATALIHTRDE